MLVALVTNIRYVPSLYLVIIILNTCTAIGPMYFDFSHLNIARVNFIFNYQLKFSLVSAELKLWNPDQSKINTNIIGNISIKYLDTGCPKKRSTIKMLDFPKVSKRAQNVQKHPKSKRVQSVQKGLNLCNVSKFVKWCPKFVVDFFLTPCSIFNRYSNTIQVSMNSMEWLSDSEWQIRWGQWSAWVRKKGLLKSDQLLALLNLWDDFMVF